MRPPTQSEQGIDASTRSWVLWSTSPSETSLIHQAVDRIFTGFSFYPEVEWKRYGYFPPEGHEVLGAWRHPEGIAFVFLMDNPGMVSPNREAQLFLSFAGEKAEMVRFISQVRRLKRGLARKSGRREDEKRLRARLQRARTSRSLKSLMTLMAPTTAAINGLALYLHKIAMPSVGDRWLLETYGLVLPLVYLAALLLLLAFTVLCVAYICKYGFLLLRRL